jgi:hypothetical protein
MRVRRRGMRSSTRLVRRRVSQRAVVLCTQTANDRSMHLAAKLGFTEMERFEEYGAEQWFGVWSSVTPSGGARGQRPIPTRSSLHPLAHATGPRG